MLTIFNNGTRTDTSLDNMQHMQHGVQGTVTVDGITYHVFALYASGKAKWPRITLDAPAHLLPVAPQYSAAAGVHTAYRRRKNAARKAWAAPVLGLTGVQHPGTWAQNAGCSCGCSPAYVYRNGSMFAAGRPVAHLTIAAAPVLGAATVARLAVANV